MTDEGMISIGYLFLGIGRATHCPFHVGLAGAKPYFAHEHVFQFHCATAFNGQCCTFGVHLHRGKVHLPTTIFTGLGGVRLTGEAHRYSSARFIPAPDRAFLSLLQHHVAAKDGRKLGFGLNKKGRKDDDKYTGRK